jgi:hypothetical protein
VFLAGLVCGLVYSRRWVQKGPRVTTRALMDRAFLIYKAHIVCVLGIFAWMVLYKCFGGTGHGPAGSPLVWFQKPWTSWLATLLLLNQPGLLDVLPTYCCFMIGTPFMLHALNKGQVKRVIAISALWWVLTNFIDPARPTIIGPINTGAFNFGAWQFLYVIGGICGHYWAHGQLPRWQPRWWTVLGLLLAVIFLSACSHGFLTLGLSQAEWLRISNKNNLAVVRLLNVVVLALLGHLWLRDRKGDLGLPFFAMMGRHSLVVFSVHCVLAIVIIGLPAIFETSPHGKLIGPLMMFTVQVISALIAERHARKKRDKALQVVPVHVRCL